MFTFLKLVQSFFKTLHSDGSPGAIAAGIALGAAFGLTPIASPHNLIVAALVCGLNVSVGAAMLGWAVFVPVGFLLDPLFHRIGSVLLLETPALTPIWTNWYNTPLLPYTNFNNTVVLGSLVAWIVLWLPIFLLARWGVLRYRATVGERVQQSRFYQAVRASNLYNFYRLFWPE